MDPFNSTDISKDEAVSYAIDQAVEMFIAENVEKSNHFFGMAEAFHQAEKFPQLTPKETNVL